MNKARFLILLSCFAFIGAAGPEQTFRRAKAGAAKSVVTEATPIGHDMEVNDYATTNKIKLPKELEDKRYLENVNDLISDASVFDDFELSKLGPYEPKAAVVHYMPYIPMPASAFSEYLVANNLSPQLKRSLFFNYQGEEYVRFFIHPSKTSSYDDLISRYGVVRDEYVGFLGASVRTFYVWNPNDSTEAPFQVKTSHHFTVNNDLKLNIPNKIARSHGNNAFFSAIPQANRKKYGITFLPETVQLLPRGKMAGTIYREIPTSFLKKGRLYVPGFYLTSHEPSVKLTWLERQVTRAKNPFAKALEILRPLLRANAYLMFVEGLKGEPHEQNIYFELDPKTEDPTDKLIFKDLDAFRVDIELRLRTGRDVSIVKEIFKPFVYLKFKKASGWKAPATEPLFDDESHTDFIVKTFGYSFCKVMKCTPAQKERWYHMLNVAMAEEVSKITGIQISENQIGKPKSKWLSRIARQHRESLNTQPIYDSRAKETKSPEIQALLYKEFARLQKLKRTAASGGANLRSPKMFFVLHQNSIIEARMRESTGIERSAGFAALTSDSTAETQNFIKKYKSLLNKSCQTLLTKAAS